MDLNLGVYPGGKCGCEPNGCYMSSVYDKHWVCECIAKPDHTRMEVKTNLGLDEGRKEHDTTAKP